MIGVVEHLSAEALAAGLDGIRLAPADHGRVELIVRRPDVDQRELLDEAVLDLDQGLVGDSWTARGSTGDRQITLMNARVAALVAVDPDRRPLAGDQLYVDLDLSHDNLPAGTRVRLGDAVVEITAEPHLGCHKFSARFGPEALRFVNSPDGRHLRLRGANARVVVGGTVRAGDPVCKVGPAQPTGPA
jgi:MOSC domain-containing protein YiiM